MQINMKVLLLILLSLLLCQGFLIVNLVSYLEDLLHPQNCRLDGICSVQGCAPCNDPSKLSRDGSKRITFGIPNRDTYILTNRMCSDVLAMGPVKAEVLLVKQFMGLILITPKGIFSAPLDRSYKIWKHREFHRKRQTVIFVTGWNSDLDNDLEAIDTVTLAYLCRGDSNFVLLDPGRLLNTPYVSTVFNAEVIGKSVASSLIESLEHADLKNFHIIGFSLGAHIAGFCGRHFASCTGKLIPRITGLDPARLCFSGAQSISGLQRGDAAFIDVIHSNPGVLGKCEPMGDADFYPNGLQSIPRGCPDIFCAHERSWLYYAESVYPGSEKNFMGVRCDSLKNLKKENCSGVAYPMGYAVPQNITGIFFLKVNERSPFGKGATVTFDSTETDV